MKKLFRQVPVLKLPNRIGGQYVFRHDNLDPRKAPCLTTCYYKGPGGCGRPQIMEFEYVADSGC